MLCLLLSRLLRATGHVSPHVARRVTGDPSPQVEPYYWLRPVGPARPGESAVNASPQRNILIVLTGAAGPMPVYCPPDPKNQPGVGKHV